MVLPTPSTPAPPLPETSPQEVRSYADGSPRDRSLMSGWSRRVAGELDEEDRQVIKAMPLRVCRVHIGIVPAAKAREMMFRTTAE